MLQVAFGAQVRVIVEGETRFSKITTLSNASNTAQSVDVKALDLQQLFVAMTKELRIAVVKLADRLHNMRTLGSMPAAKQAKIANETLQVRSSPCSSAKQSLSRILQGQQLSAGTLALLCPGRTVRLQLALPTGRAFLASIHKLSPYVAPAISQAIEPKRMPAMSAER